MTVTTEPKLWRRWAGDRWETLPAGGELLVARGLGDVRATLKV